MKYKILQERKETKEEFKIIGDVFWRCDKCDILYGKGETILKDKDNMFCPVHSDRSMSFERLGYWLDRYEVEEIA